MKVTTLHAISLRAPNTLIQCLTFYSSSLNSMAAVVVMYSVAVYKCLYLVHNHVILILIQCHMTGEGGGYSFLVARLATKVTNKMFVFDLCLCLLIYS